MEADRRARRDALTPRNGTGTRGRAMKAMFGAALAASLFAAAASSQELLDPDQAFKLSARALDSSTIEVSYRIAPGYYLYRKNFKLELGAPAGATLGEPRFPPGRMKKDPIFGEVEIYRDEVKIQLAVTLPPGAKEMTLLAGSQGCSDIGVCYVPQSQKLNVAMTEHRGDSLPSLLGRPKTPADFSVPAASSVAPPAARPQADILKALPPPPRRPGL